MGRADFPGFALETLGEDILKVFQLKPIAPDEVIDTMRRIGNALPACLKETSEGGLATTPSAQKVREKMDGGQ